MRCAAESLYGEVAVAYGFVTPERLRECDGPPGDPQAGGSLVGRLQQKGLLSPVQVQIVTRDAAFLAALKEDRAYARDAVQRGLVDQVHVDACLAEQRTRFFSGDGRLLRLAQILRERGWLDGSEDLDLEPIRKPARDGDASLEAYVSPAAGRAPSASPQMTGQDDDTSRLNETVRRNPCDLQAYIRLADAHLRLGCPQDAIAVYRAARRFAPAHRELAFRLCELLDGQRDVRGSAEVLEDLSQRHVGDLEIERRLRAARSGGLGRRIAELNAALARHPASAELRLELANCLLERGDRAAALVEFQASAREGATSTRILPLLEGAVYADLTWANGVAALRDAYLRAHAPNRAVRLLEERAAATGSTVRDELDLVELYLALGRTPRAVARMQALLPRPDAPREEFIAIAREIIRKEPSRADAHRFLADAFARKGDPARVAHHLKAYLYFEPRDVAALRELAGTLERLQDGAGAAVAWRAVLREAPTDARAWRSLGAICLAEGHIDQAREAAGHAVSLAPKDPASADLARSVGGRVLDGEIDRLVLAIQADPRQSHLRLTLADVYRRRGRMEDARRELDLAAVDAEFCLAASATRLLVDQARHEPSGVPLLQRLDRIDELRKHLRRVTGDRAGRPAGQET